MAWNLKPRPLLKREKRNAIKDKRFDDDIILANYNVILIILIYCQFEAIKKPVSKCYSQIFINNNFWTVRKTENRIKKSKTQV